LTVKKRPLTVKKRPLTVKKRPLTVKKRPLTVKKRPLTVKKRPLTVTNNYSQEAAIHSQKIVKKRLLTVKKCTNTNRLIQTYTSKITTETQFRTEEHRIVL
jgi:hypothetical protein